MVTGDERRGFFLRGRNFSGGEIPRRSSRGNHPRPLKKNIWGGGVRGQSALNPSDGSLSPLVSEL